MRFFLLLALICLATNIEAQDTTATAPAASGLYNENTPIAIKERAKHHHHAKAFADTLPNYRLYNYSANSINNLFDDKIRPGANDRIDLDFDFFGNSNRVPALFGYDLLFNAPITQALIDRTDKMLTNTLKFEEYMKTGWSYKRYLKKIDAVLIVGYDYRQMLNLSGPKQAFETFFYGNARFEGDTASLSNIRFQFYNYNQFTLGIYKTIDYGRYQMEIGVTGSMLQAINNLDIETDNNTWLYTAPYGEYLLANYNITFNQGWDGAPRFFGNTGFGGSGDFHLAFKNKDRWKLSFDLSDLGVMTFRKTPTNYNGAQYDSIVGIYLPSITNLSAQTFDSLNLDSTLKSKLPGKSNNQYTTFMPFSFSATFSKPIMHDRLVLNFGFQYRDIPGYYAYGYAKVNYFIKPGMVFSASVGSGAYSLCNIGVEFSRSWKYFDFTVGTSNLLGLALPAYYPGSALYLRLASPF